jgi:hypothetical protein
LHRQTARPWSTPEDDRLVAIGAGRDHVDRHAGELLDALEVATRIRRQLRIVAVMPTVDSFQPGSSS